MDSKISLIIIKTGSTSGKEISQLCESITWSGKRSSPTRTLEFTILDDDGYNHDRAGIDIEKGYHALFYYDDEELFRGIILRQTGQYSKKSSYKAYDVGIYLSNNKDTFVYESQTATYVFKDVCNRFGITVGSAASTSYTIPDLTKKKTTGWDAIEDALSLDYENTGTQYYVYAKQGKLYLAKRAENLKQWVLETGVNIATYKYTKSLEDVKTRIKLLSSEGTTLASATNSSLEAKIGVFQGVDTPDESLTTAQIKSLASSLLSEQSATEHTLQLSKVLGQVDVISGVAVYVEIDHLDLSKTFYVDSDTHTFKGNLHTMSLTLNLSLESD